MSVKPVGKYKVGKSFISEGVRIESGSIIDVTEWRNAQVLINRRYLIPLSSIEETSPKPAAKKTIAKKQAAPKVEE
jgi:hypothetical protein